MRVRVDAVVADTGEDVDVQVDHPGADKQARTVDDLRCFRPRQGFAYDGYLAGGERDVAHGVNARGGIDQGSAPQQQVIGCRR